MGQIINIGKVADFPLGTIKTVTVGEKSIAVANVEGKLFAISDLCTHAQCSLGTLGHLDGKVVTCGCHGGRFDVTSGKVLGLPSVVDEISYAVKVEGDTVSIEI